MAKGKCCFCIDLRVVSLIIGYLNMFAGIIVIVFTILSLFGVHMANAYRAPETPEMYQNQVLQIIPPIMTSVLAALLVFLIHSLGFTMVLLVGLHQYKRGHVKAYLIYALISIVLYIIVYIILFFVSSGSEHITAAQIAREGVSLILNILFFLVIRSYYLKMDEPANRPANKPANKPAIYNIA